MKITRKFMIYVICTGTVLFAMAMVFLYSSLTHIDALERLIEKNFSIETQSDIAAPNAKAEHKNQKYHEVLAPLFFLIATVGLLIIVVQLIYISKCIVTPISQAAEFSYKLAKGQFPSRMNFNHRQCDEIVSLIKSLNFMRDRMQSSISKLKLSHKREKDTREKVEKANRLQSDFLASVSPDLRNPMNSIRGWAQLLMQDIEVGKEDIHLTERLQMINHSIEMLDSQVAGLLDVSDLHSDYDLHNLSSFNPMEFMNELVDYNLIRFHDRDIAMENHFSSTIPDKIMTDRDLLFSILDVVVSAIIDITRGKIKISYGCYADDNILSFWVRPEFDNSELRTLVKQFEQYSTYPVNKLPTIKGASVLNLLIAASRAKKLHGELKIETHDDKHTFRICFNSTDIETDEILGRTPLSHAASNAKKDSYEYENIEDIVLDKYSPPYNLNVLIADHDRDNCQIITQFLEDAGCRTVSINNSDSYHNVADGNDYDISILGRRMAEELSMTDAKESLISKPIIVTASYLNEIQRRKLIAIGVDHFFVKPLDFNKLKLTVAALGISAKKASPKS
jgi:signal transduction histidine kinase